MKNFLRLLLPASGWYCTGELIIKDGDRPRFSNRFWESLDEAITCLLAADGRGKNVYIAQASYSTPNSRTADNTGSCKSFWVDIDCGADKFEKTPNHAYPTKQDGITGLSNFCQASGFPLPYIVDSGNGLYAHWILEEAIPALNWRGLADLFKDVLRAYEFKTDPARTADVASVLRPPGVRNWKDIHNPKPVQLLREGTPIAAAAFVEILRKAAEAKSVTARAVKAPRKPTINQQFKAIPVYEDRSYSAHIVADKCPQIHAIRKTQGDVPEPVWYAGIGVLRFCQESPDIIHEWSCGYAGYTEAETDSKIAQSEERQTGPTTCKKLFDENPVGCQGCPHKDKINSPLMLGLVIELPKDDLGAPIEKWAPKRFVRGLKGIHYTPEEGDPVVIYPWDLWPVSVQYDESLGYETVNLRHTHPLNGEKEIAIRSSLVKDKKGLLTTLMDNHVQVMSGNAETGMVRYMESFIQKLRSENRTHTLYAQMGWRLDKSTGELSFIIGEDLYSANRPPEKIGLGSKIPYDPEVFRTRGDIREWIDLTSILSEPRLTPYAFALLAGGFGAPLLKFTGYNGAVVVMVGKSGLGKTMMLRWITSMFGVTADLMNYKNDTLNFLIRKIGLAGSLPFVIDEMTNMDPRDLSELVYGLTHGKEKGRLKKDLDETTRSSWNTITTVTSNASLVEKLSFGKGNPEAEISRVTEIFLSADNCMSKEESYRIFNTLDNNYGAVGRVYAQYLVEHAMEHKNEIDKLTRAFEADLKSTPVERFWIATAACAVYGGLIAERLGLIRFSAGAVYQWFREYFEEMRKDKKENTMDGSDLLGNFISTHVDSILVVRQDKHTKEIVRLNDVGREIHGRYDKDKELLYISRPEFNRFCASKQMSAKHVAQRLYEDGALQGKDTRMVLTKGFAAMALVQQYCLVIDMTAPVLGRSVATLVTKAAEAESGEIKTEVG